MVHLSLLALIPLLGIAHPVPSDNASAPTSSVAPASLLSDDEESPKQPNILLIITDQFSPRALGIAGNSVVKTPRLDQLGEQGAYFRQGYCNDPICVPSRYSMLSGRYPTEIGVFTNSLPPIAGVRYLPEYLNDFGYFTGSSGKNHFIPEEETHGFQDLYRHAFYVSSYWTHYGPWYERRFKELGLKGDPYFWKRTKDWHKAIEPDDGGMCIINPYPAELCPENWVTLQALRLIDRAKEKDKPFFVHASYFAPHHPYGPLQEYYDLYEGVDMPLPPNFYHEKRSQRTYTDDEHKFIMRHYYGFVSQVDHYIGELLDGLDERGLAENTLVFMVSDHGDMMGEFGELTKGPPWEGSLGVPFFMRWPGRIPAGQVISEPVSLLDIVPTIFDALQEPAPEAAQGDSILPLAEAKIETLDREVYGIDVRINPFLFVSVRERRWKLIMRPQTRKFDAFALYDMENDTYELTDLSKEPEHKATLDRLKAKALAFWETQSLTVKRPFPEDQPYSAKPPLKERDR